MAGATDTARFFLEQSLPELRELEEKGLFTRDEVSAIAKKRSDFEHKVHSNGVKPADYARYAEFEMNLEFLRRKRAKRTRAKMHGHAWQRRIMSLMERATRKFPNDMSLWMQYAELARKQNAFQKLSKILTSMVRLHPTAPEAWIYAATYAMGELGDVAKARSYMQRGLRFCKDSESMWLEYAKLELAYLAKIHARREILGLDEAPEKIQEASAVDEVDADMIVLPTVTSEEMMDDPKSADAAAVDLGKTPAFSGAIPMAIFDGAMDHFQDEQLGAQFFDLAVEFESLPCAKNIAQHIVDRLMLIAPESVSTLDAMTRLPLVGIKSSTSVFPQALGKALGQLEHSLSVQPSVELTERSLQWLAGYLNRDLDTEIREVIATTFARLLQRRRRSLEDKQIEGGDEFAALLEKLYGIGGRDKVMEAVQDGLKLWPANTRLLQLRSSDGAD